MWQYIHRWDTELHGYYRSPLKDAMHRAMAEAASGGTRGCAQVCWRKCREETQHNQQCIGANSVSMADILQVAGAMGVAMSEGPNYVHDIWVRWLSLISQCFNTETSACVT